jgi:hypothetical protein
VTRKPKFRPPFVGDPPAGAAEAYAVRDGRRVYAETKAQVTDHALPQIEDGFKTRPCSVCGKAQASFAIDYPQNPKWFCFQHAGEVMPELMENADRVKLNEVRRLAVRGAQRWLDLYQACANGDVEGAKGIWKHIRDVSVEASDKLKAIKGGSEGGTANG